MLIVPPLLFLFRPSEFAKTEECWQILSWGLGYCVCFLIPIRRTECCKGSIPGVLYYFDTWWQFFMCHSDICFAGKSYRQVTTRALNSGVHVFQSYLQRMWNFYCRMTFGDWKALVTVPTIVEGPFERTNSVLLPLLAYIEVLRIRQSAFLTC